MAQPQWITAAGSLGTIPEGIFYSVAVEAEAGPGETVYYRVVAGELPTGVQVSTTGIIEGVPRNIALVQGVPTEVSVDTTSKFAVRAYTMTTLYLFGLQKDWVHPELEYLINSKIMKESAGCKARGTKILTSIKKHQKI